MSVDLDRIEKLVDERWPDRSDERRNEWNDGTFRRFRLKGIQIDVSDDGDIDVGRYLVREYMGKEVHPFTEKHRETLQAILVEMAS